jgi:phenylalanine-4-hydroxylase
MTRVSEASRLSRLYWWTAEYGLVGTPSDYKLYGSGLLSSLWESFSCHDPQVTKIPLGAGVTEVDYDVTRPQPQLFVTPSFEALHDVLDAVVAELPSVRGGEGALEAALAAREVATIELVGGLAVSGVLERRFTSDGRSTLLSIAGPARAEVAGVSLKGPAIEVVLGESCAALERVAPGRIDVLLAGGVRLRGELARIERGTDGTALLQLKSGEFGSLSEAQLLPGHMVAIAGEALGAHAGAPPDFYPETELPDAKVPKPRSLPPRERELLGLYESALAALRSPLGSEVVPAFERIHQALVRDFEDDWLLRWNLLESLQKLGHHPPLAGELHRELSRLEVFYRHRQPIASGLAYLSRLARSA